MYVHNNTKLTNKLSVLEHTIHNQKQVMVILQVPKNNLIAYMLVRD